MSLRMSTWRGAAFTALMPYCCDSARAMGSFPHLPPPLLLLLTALVAPAVANQNISATTAPPPSTTSPALNYIPSPPPYEPSTSTSWLDLIMMDPFFPYYAAGAALYLLNLIAVGVVGCCRGLPIGETVKAVVLAFFFCIFGWAFVFVALKKHTGRCCCCGTSQIKIKMKTENHDPKQAAADDIMAKHKKDFLDRNGSGQPGHAGSGNADNARHGNGDGDGTHAVANTRPFFMPFGLQYIPDPYGPPLPTPYARPATIARV